MKKPILAVAATLVVVAPVWAQTASGQTSGGSGVIIRTPPSTVNSGGDRNVGSPGPTYPERLRNYTNPSIYNTRPGGVPSSGGGGQRR
ncbi:hypothetical protein [Hyphomicrobium sp.]|uniref:hypothetical protein n=1 Tax=Hyphomicrobium sp. TaxID=82 RepID=UPI001DDE9DE6|nr:hypothetical protein [Hyphomicrobium sp.]MBY0560344.1 hypothetical protein [Hyphomicrobium sp.]